MNANTRQRFLRSPRYRILRAVAIAAALVASATCSDSGPVTPGGTAGDHASFALKPSFAALAPGGPTIQLSKVRAVLTGPNGETTAAEASFTDGVATLTFDVQISGSSAEFTLDVTAYDTAGNIVYRATQRIRLRPGDNTGLPSPTLVYDGPDAKLTAIHITPGPTTTIPAGTTTTLSVSGTLAGGDVLTPPVGWTSSDPSIATVDANGVIHAGQSQGTVTIVATSATGLTDQVTIKVRAAVDKVIVAPGAVDVIRGTTKPVMAELRDATNKLIDDRTAVWSSSDSSVATVSPTGVVAGLKVGKATITATSEGKTGSGVVTVVTPVESITLPQPKVSITSLKATTPIQFTLVAVAGGSIVGIVPTFTSSAPNVVTVSADGVLTSVGNGTATITIEAEGGVTTQLDVTVLQVATTATISPRAASVSSIGGTASFSFLAMDAGGNRVDKPVVTWASSDSSIATIVDGVATARRAGSVTITATVDGKSDAATFIVAPVARYLVVLTTRPEIRAGETAVVSAQVADASGTPLGSTPATFSTTTPNVALVRGNVVTGLSPGIAHIVGTATGGLVGTLDIRVLPPTPPPGNTASGIVVNAVTGAPLPGASVTSPAGPAVVSDADGSFTVGNIANGGSLSVTAPGFVTTQYLNVVLANGNVEIGSIPLAPTSGQTGSISGQVIDATTGNGVSGATVTIRTGVNATTGAGTTVTTDQGGNYTVQLPAGTYTASATLQGFATGSATIVSIGGDQRLNQNMSIVPNTGLRITLTWGATPEDLDSHLFGPAASGGTFHTWYGNLVGPDGQTLDTDATEGFGPENSTVLTVIPGIYHFYVHHYYSSDPAANMASSGATVTVRLNGTVLGVFHPPVKADESSSDVWDVFTLSGGTITPGNQFVGTGILGTESARGSRPSPNGNAQVILDGARRHPKPARRP